MKQERRIYSCFLLLIITLLLLETIHQTALKREEVFETDLGRFDQMSIDFDCNVFISKGEGEKVVVEGPGNLIRQIKSENDGDILRLKRKSKGIIALLIAPFVDGKNRLNIYIRIDDPSKIITSEKMTIISSDFISSTSPPLLSRIQEISLSFFSRILRS